MKITAKLGHGAAYSSLFLLTVVLAQNATAATSSSDIAGSGAGNLASSADTTMPSISDTQGPPPFGSSVQLGNFSGLITQTENTLAGLPLPEGLVVTPSIGLQEEFTTSNFGYSGQQPTFVTLIRPGLLVSDQTRTTTAVLNYSPYIELYDGRAYEDSIQQSLNGSLDIALVPGSVSLALRGYVTAQATSGGVNPGGTLLLGPNDRTTTQSYSIEPSYHHYFDGLGTFDAAYVLGVTRQNGSNAFLPNSSVPYFNNGNYVSQTETASFLSVPIFLRFDDEPSVSFSEYKGTGVLNDAHQYFVSDSLRYAVIRNYLLTGSVGYEDVQYQGIPPTRIQDPTWSVGVDITPAENASLVARYQHLYGFNAPYIIASFPLTQRTSLAASYTDTLATPQQQIGANVAGSSVNALGVPVGTTSGLPVVLTNQTLALQSSLQRDTVFSVSTNTVYSRDSIGFSIIRDQQTLVSVSPGNSGFSQSSISGTINYTHQLTSLSNISTYFNFSRIHSPVVSNSNNSTYAASISYTRQLTPSLFWNAQYIVSNQQVGGFGNVYGYGYGSSNIQNSVIIGIQKTF